MRLIDVDKITSGEIAKYLGRRYEFCVPDIEDMLREQPTAFDRYAVIEQLKEKSRYARIVGEEKPCELLKLAEVIAIVEGGGVDGD